VASLVSFGNGGAAAGIIAIASGCTIYTDVGMAATGISRQNAGVFGCGVVCAMDELVEQLPTQNGSTTRAARAMKQLGTALNGAIVAIGNAPTALLALLEMIDNEGVRPALVVGMPVGFVQARESKDALRQRDVPYITVTGTRGGSAMAAATVNALLKTAVANRR
jgi:precorrin-8X/cobalt-precorrin-8 methylmutase